MSHSVDIKTQFKNTNNLLAQFKALGWRIEMNTKCTTYPSDPRRGEIHKYVAKNPSSIGYDVGVNLDNEGNAYFVCDFYDRSIEQSLGKNLQKVKQGYALSEIKKRLREEDLEYKVSELPTGELIVVAEK
jgi:hypothetical protein